MTLAQLARPRVLTPEQATALVRSPVTAETARYAELIHDACVITDPVLGEPVLANLPLAAHHVAELTEALTSIQTWPGVGRTGVLHSRSVTFGMSPRRPTHRRDSCSASKLSSDRPDVHQVLAGLAVPLADMLREQVSAEIVERDRLTIAEIEQEWRMAPGAAWTSGVVNHTAQLPYHRDRMNFDAWSVMPVIRSGVSGGALHIPEYGLTMSCRNGYVVAFNGHRLVHGVTPLTAIRRRPPGYRYSVVYYALRGMKDCFTFAAELAAGQAKRTSREEHQREYVTGARPDWRV